MSLPDGVFWTRDDLTLRCASRAPAGTFDLLQRVVWGTTGARFRMRDPGAHVEDVTGLQWVALEEGDTLLGVYALLSRERTWGDEVVPTIYRTALAIDPRHLHRKLGGLLVRETRSFLVRHLERGVIFGLIEGENARSLVLSERHGYRHEGTLEVVMPSWRSPRARDGVRRLRPAEHDEAVARLESLYAGHALADFSRSTPTAKLWVYEQGGEVVASLMADPHRWAIEGLGAGGWIERLLPWVPLYGRLIDPADFRFLWMQHLWFRDPRALHPLMEGVLHAHQAHVGLVIGDPTSPVWRAWRAAGWLGVLAPIRSRTHVMVHRAGVGPAPGPLVYTMSGA